MKRILSFVLLASPALADLPVVEGAVATQSAAGWSFSVSVRHADTGWDHYADAWTVFAPDGTELGHRPLAHPHVNEQPFTRSQSGIRIPDGTERVIIRAHDSLHGWGPDYVMDLQ